jgi:hypothetical protein
MAGDASTVAGSQTARAVAQIVFAMPILCRTSGASLPTLARCSLGKSCVRRIVSIVTVEDAFALESQQHASSLPSGKNGSRRSMISLS